MTNETTTEIPTVEALPAKPNKAENFKKTHPYSLTFSKLMKKWSCPTPEAWRALRAKHKKEHFVGTRNADKISKKKARILAMMFKLEFSGRDRNDRGSWNNGPRKSR